MMVLDHRALLAIALAEPVSDWLLGELRHARGRVAAPAHQAAAVLAVVVDLQLGGRLEPSDAAAAVSAVLTFPVQPHAPDHADVLRARELVPVMPFLDGLHVALAERLAVPMLTTRAGVHGSARCELLSPPSWSSL